MRVIVMCVLIVGALLSGCGELLPYYISIDKQQQEPGECVLPLGQLVTQVHSKVTPEWTVKMVQQEFEQAVAREVATLNCKGKSDPAKFLPETVGSKWMATYAFEPTDPDNSLERFQEFLESSRYIQQLLVKDHDEQPPIADRTRKDNQRWLEEWDPKDAAWCGDPNTPACEEEKDRRFLYKVITNPNNLYDKLLSKVKEITDSADRGRRLVVLGYEIPWDAEKLIKYGVTFYFDDKRGTKPAQPHVTYFIGYDLLYGNEATPEPCVVVKPPSSPISACAQAPEEKEVQEREKTEEELSWASTMWRATGYPFSIAIGVKNAAFELAKAPISWIPGALFGRDDPWQYPVQNLLSAYNALQVEAELPRGGAPWGFYRVLTELPLVGQLFQYNAGTDRSEPDVLPTDVRRKVFLSRGIYGGQKWGQDTGLWFAATRAAYPGYDIYSPPYRHGTVTDVVWSMFNLSHGPAYNEARYVMDHAGRRDRLYLAGHSGGVQRSAVASRILRDHSYSVIKVFGVAGPSIGQASVDSRYPDAFRIYLNTQSGEDQDVVSKVGDVAGAFATVLDYAVIKPLKFTVGGLCFSNSGCRDTVYEHMDRLGFLNARIIEVERKPSSRHQTPLRMSLTNRLVFDAYIRSEFAMAFREDLERPSEPHKTDRPHAFPWKE